MKLALLLSLLSILSLLAIGCRTSEAMSVRLKIPRDVAEGQLARIAITQTMYGSEIGVHQGKIVGTEVSPGRAISPAVQVADNVVAQGDAAKTGDTGDATQTSAVPDGESALPATATDTPPAEGSASAE